MNGRVVNENTRRLLALLTAIAIISGILAIFPAIAVTMVGASGNGTEIAGDGEIEAETETEAIEQGEAYPGYVMLDADFINANIVPSSGMGAEYGGITDNGAYKSVRLNACDVVHEKYPTGKHNDPYISLMMNGVYDASEYKYVTIIVKPDKETRGTEEREFQLFFDTDSDTPNGYDESKSKSARYIDSSGFQVLTYDFSKHNQWKGKIEKIRLDFFNGSSDLGTGDYCDIAYIILSKTVEYVYESAYEALKTIYTPAQVLDDFKPESLAYFQHSANTHATGVSIANGRVLYESKPREGEENPYNDPYSTFRYKDYMNSIGRGDDILVTHDDPETPEEENWFSYTVLKFRTNDKIPGGDLGMQIFVFTDEETGPKEMDQVGTNIKHLSPSDEYQVSQNYNWQTTVFEMDCQRLADNPLTEAKGDAVSRWTYTPNFNGFRLDWAGTGAEGAILEMDEIIFFKTEKDARSFSKAVNMLKLPSSYPTESNEDEGEDLVLDTDVEGCVEYDANGIEAILDCPSGVTSSVEFALEGWSSLALSADNTAENPYALFRMGSFKMDMCPNLTFILKARGISADKSASLKLYYKTVSMTDFDNRHSVKAAYTCRDSWQIISFDMSDMPDLIEDVTEFKLEFLSGAESFESGAGVEIYSFAACESNDIALEYVKSKMMGMYTPINIMSGFSGGDDAYFESNGKTEISYVKENNSIKLTLTEDESNPSVDWLYSKFMIDSYKYKATSANDFGCFVFNVKCESASGGSNMEIILLDESRVPLYADPLSDSSEYCSSGKVSCASGTWKALVFDMSGDGANENSWYGDIENLRIAWADEGKEGDSVEISQIYLFETTAEAAEYFELINSFEITVGIPEQEPEPEETLPEIGEETETRPSFDDPEEPTESEEPTETEQPTESENPTETEEPTKAEDTDEETTSEETESESESETESESESETESESENSSPNLPGGFDPDSTPPEGETEKAEGSKTPFVVACISLSGLSGASIISVIAIKLKLKLLI